MGFKPTKAFLPGLGHFFVTWVRSATSRFGKFPLKIPAFQFFLFGVKKFSMGWVKKYPSQRWVGPLFIAGLKYARVWSIAYL